MKNLFLISFVLFLFSCSGGSSSNTQETYTDSDIEVKVKSLLNQMDIDVQNVEIADGSSEGGLRNMVIAIVVNSERSQQAAELSKTMECGKVVNEKMKANLDETTVVVGDKSGNSLAAITVKVSDTEIFQRTKDAQSYVKTWTVLRFDDSYLPEMLSLAKSPK